MAVEHLLSDLFANGYGENGVDPARGRGRPIRVVGTLTNSAGGSSGSTYKIGDFPADCILQPETIFDVEEWGYAQVVIGTIDDTDALLDVARSAATTQSPITRFGTGHGKPLWELLGLAARPSDNIITLYAHAEATATAAGTMPFQIDYLHR